MPEYFFTKHALEAMESRSITHKEVLEVLRLPEVSYRSNTGPHAGKNSVTHQRGKLYVVVAGTPTYHHTDFAKQFPCYAVITAGLRSTEQWNNEDAINRNTDTKGT